jgi:endonuclease-3
MLENLARRILETLKKKYKMPEWIISHDDPFKTLIVTIISQNTNDKNTARAFKNLSNSFRIAPEVLANIKTEQIERCLKVAGLYKRKARTIKQVSKIILDQYNSSLKPILSLPLEEARKTLLQFPGIGPKTADVLLLFSAEKPTIPVDTHVNRVSKRLTLVPASGNYETIRQSLQTLYKPRDYLAVHVLFIQHGRKFCKARKPICTQCPVNTLCPSSNLSDESD